MTVIGVAGGTGSGKSTLVKRLQEAFKEEEVVTLCHDYYYKAHPELTYEERTKLNYDHPQSFDTDMLVEHIRTLKTTFRSNIRSIRSSITTERPKPCWSNLRR